MSGPTVDASRSRQWTRSPGATSSTDSASAAASGSVASTIQRAGVASPVSRAPPSPRPEITPPSPRPEITGASSSSVSPRGNAGERRARQVCSNVAPAASSGTSHVRARPETVPSWSKGSIPGGTTVFTGTFRAVAVPTFVTLVVIRITWPGAYRSRSAMDTRLRCGRASTQRVADGTSSVVSAERAVRVTGVSPASNSAPTRSTMPSSTRSPGAGPGAAK